MTKAAKLILSLTLVCSGLLKGVDPYGTALKIHEYLDVFGMSSLKCWSEPLAVLLSLSILCLFRRECKTAGKAGRLTAAIAALVVLEIPVYGILHLPLMDTGGFKVGTCVADKQPFHIYDESFSDKTDEFTQKGRNVLVVKKQDFDHKELRKLDGLRESCKSEGYGLCILGDMNLSRQTDDAHYLCNSYLAKTLARASRNSVIILDDGVVTKKTLLRYIRIVR